MLLLLATSTYSDIGQSPFSSSKLSAVKISPKCLQFVVLTIRDLRECCYYILFRLQYSSILYTNYVYSFRVFCVSVAGFDILPRILVVGCVITNWNWTVYIIMSGTFLKNQTLYLWQRHHRRKWFFEQHHIKSIATERLQFFQHNLTIYFKKDVPYFEIWKIFLP